MVVHSNTSNGILGRIITDCFFLSYYAINTFCFVANVLNIFDLISYLPRASQFKLRVGHK